MRRGRQRIPLRSGTSTKARCGCLPCQAEQRGPLWISAGVLALGAYGFAAAFQPSPDFGRIMAAYGAVFVAGSPAWGVAGALICLAGVAVIMYAPRG